MAAGSAPGPAGIGLCLLIGVVAALCTGDRCGPLALIAVLTGAQVVSHLALSATMPMTPSPMTSMPDHAGMQHSGMDHSAMDHAGGGSGITMLLTHLVAIPVCAVLIAAAVAVIGVITSVLATLRRRPTGTVEHPTLAPAADRGAVRRDRVDRAAGAGERGPPLLIG